MFIQLTKFNNGWRLHIKANNGKVFFVSKEYSRKYNAVVTARSIMKMMRNVKLTGLECSEDEQFGGWI